jgi:diadenosine tetraphosphatase ApaH/serine/threonine PP2A family protein phosphatase
VRWGLISDIHGNLPALEAVLEELDRFAVERYACLGDLVGYGPHPNEVTATVAGLDPVIVAGNHDLAADGRLRLDWFAPSPRSALEWTIGQLAPETRDYLARLPVVEHLGSVRLVHALPPESPVTYLVPGAVGEAQTAAAEWHEQLCFVGHTHRPQRLDVSNGRAGHAELLPLLTYWTVRSGGPRWIVNLGSVGQPRDGDARAACAVWDDEAGVLQTRRVVYDIERVSYDIEAAGLPIGSATRLRLGE